MEPNATIKNQIQAKLIFNPSVGAAKTNPVGILDIIHEMQNWNLVPEIFLIEPDIDMPGMIEDALARGIRLFVVCGGDGTISSVAKYLAGTDATLGLVPIGTQNNTALSLGIPADVAADIAILRNGKRINVDVGMVSCGTITTPFLEVCSVGLVSNLFPSADDIQHGNLARVGDFLTTLASSPPAKIHLFLDNQQEINEQGHVLLVSNMPNIGFHYQVSSPDSFNDGLLDVLFFAELSKLELLGYVLQGVGENNTDDPRIQRYHVRKVEIDTDPAMPVMADGNALGEGRVSIEVRQSALAVMVGQPVPEPLPETSKVNEQRTPSASFAES